MNQECYPHHPSTNNSARKLRLKIITSNGRRFICPVSYECTVEELADRILKVYAQFQRDPTHRYYASDGKVARRVYNIRSHSYYLGRMDFVGDLLNDLDEIECDVEQSQAKPKQKNNEKKRNEKKKRKHEIVREEREESSDVKAPHKQKTQKNEKATISEQAVAPKVYQQSSGIKKFSTDINEGERRSPAQRPRLVQSEVNPLKLTSEPKASKENKQEQRQSPVPAIKLTSPSVNPLESIRVQKLNLNKGGQRIKNQQSSASDKKAKQQQAPRQVTVKQPKQTKGTTIKQPVERRDTSQSRDTRKVEQQEQGISRRKKSCLVVESQEEKQSGEPARNIYSKSYIEGNRRKIFNRFDDDSE